MMDIIGSSDAFDEIIIQARNKRIKASRKPLDIMKESMTSYLKEAISQSRSVQNLIKTTLIGRSEGNNVFKALNSVKAGIIKHIESQGEIVQRQLDPLVKMIEDQEKSISEEFKSVHSTIETKFKNLESKMMMMNSKNQDQHQVLPSPSAVALNSKVASFSFMPVQPKLKVEAPKQITPKEEEKKTGSGEPPLLEAFKITHWDEVQLHSMKFRKFKL